MPACPRVVPPPPPPPPPPPMNLPLRLDRPLVFFDLETTGTSAARDRIVEMAAVKIDDAGNRDVRVRRFNPGVPIPAEATDVHGIADADVAGEPPFASRARALAGYLGTCDLAGFNIRRYDLPMLMAEFRRAGVAFEVGDRRLLDMQIIFHRKEPRDLAAAARFYLGREPERAHSAEDDVRTTIAVMAAQLEKYADLPGSVQGLHAYCDEFAPFESEFARWFSKSPATGSLVFRRGKHRGTPLDEVAQTAPDYLEWMLRADDMDSEVRDAAMAALARHDPDQTTLALPKRPESDS